MGCFGKFRWRIENACLVQNGLDRACRHGNTISGLFTTAGDLVSVTKPPPWNTAKTKSEEQLLDPCKRRRAWIRRGTRHKSSQFLDGRSETYHMNDEMMSQRQTEIERIPERMSRLQPFGKMV